MVARALQRKYPDNYIYASYGDSSAFASVGMDSYLMSDSVKQKMVQFDNGLPVEPFKFRLRKN